MFLELAPGGALAIGTSFEDAQLIWTSLIRLTLGVLILFLVIRLLLDAHTLHRTGNADIESNTIDSLWSVGKTIVMVLIASAMAPYAVNTFFNVIHGGLSLNFG